MVVYASAIAQTPGNGVTVTGFKLNKSGETVEVTFNAHADSKAVKSDYTLTLTPVLANGADKATLPSIIIEGKRARIAAQREAMSQGARRNAEPRTAYVIGNGSTVNYTATLPYAAWMEGSALRLERTMEGCCSSMQQGAALLAENLVIAPPLPVVAEEIPEPLPEPEPVKTTGDLTAQKHPFIAPVSEQKPLNDNYFEEFMKGSREGSLTFYFRQGVKSIERDYRGNGLSIDEMLQAIQTIERSPDSRVVKVVIAGFASPEGSGEVNNRLASQRAATLRELIIDRSRIPASAITVYNGGIDWWALRRMVEQSDMPKREQVVDIIDNTPVWDARRQTGRNGELMRLDSGRPYRYMMQNFFLELRNATYIKVYYENR